MGTGWRVPHARKGAGPGHSRVPVRARKGALTSGALSRVQIQANSWIDSVVQIQAPIVFLGAHCVEIVLHLAKYGLMKLVPIYMFSVGAGTKT